MRLKSRFAVMASAACLAGAASAQSPVLPGIDGSICDFVAANAGRNIGAPEALRPGPAIFDLDKPFGTLLTKRALADVDGDGDLELLDIGVSGGTARGDVPIVLGANERYGEPLPSQSDDSIRWANGARWLQFGNAWHLVYFRDEQLEQAMAVDTVTGGGRLACLFQPAFDEKVVYISDDPQIRAEFEKRQPVLHGGHWNNRQLAGAPINAEDRRYIMTLGTFREVEGGLVGEGASRWLGLNTATALVLTDIDADGTNERIARFSYSSSAGRGCDAYFVDLLPDAGQSAPDPELRGRILYAQGGGVEDIYSGACGFRSEIVEIGGRGYIYVERIGASDPARRMVAIGAGIVAQSEFTPRHTVTFDLTKGGAIKPPN